MISNNYADESMAQIVVRDLEEKVKTGLKRRAQRHGRSMEEEVREILRNAVREGDRPSLGFGSRAAALFSGIALNEDLPEVRGQNPHPANFDE